MVSTEEYSNLEGQVRTLRRDLENCKREKELWFKKKEELKEIINSKISEIKEIQTKKDKTVKEMSYLRKQRDLINQKVKALIGKIRSLSFKSGPSSSNILEKIKILEGKIEVETNFKKEKQIMEEIKKLKKQHGEIVKENNDHDTVEKEIKESKKIADEFHQKLNEASQSEEHKKFMDLSKEINLLKKEQEDAFAKFIEFKKKFNENSKEYKRENNKFKKLERPKEIKFKNNFKRERKIDAEEFKRQKDQKIIDKKIEEVENKIKTKKKLTNEDLIVLQGKRR